MFTAAPNGSYRSSDGCRLRWRGYGDADPHHLFACRCDDYLWTRKCRHSAALTALYRFAAKYWPDAGSTFADNLSYYQIQRAMVLAREEARSLGVV